MRLYRIEFWISSSLVFVCWRRSLQSSQWLGISSLSIFGSLDSSLAASNTGRKGFCANYRGLLAGLHPALFCCSRALSEVPAFRWDYHTKLHRTMQCIQRTRRRRGVKRAVYVRVEDQLGYAPLLSGVLMLSEFPTHVEVSIRETKIFPGYEMGPPTRRVRAC